MLGFERWLVAEVMRGSSCRTTVISACSMSLSLEIMWGRFFRSVKSRCLGGVLWSHSEIEKQFGSVKGFDYLQFKET